MRQGCTRCVGYLPWRICQARNKYARVKLHEAKLCICSAWFPVHLPYLWTKERCVGVMYAAPCVCFFRSCKRLVDNKYSRESSRIFFCFWICCSHPCLKEIQTKKNHFAWIPKFLPTLYFVTIIYIFFQERDFRKDFLLFTILFSTQSKAEIKLHNHNKKVFWQYTHYEPWKVICTSLWCCAFFVEVCPGLYFISRMI